MKPNEDSKNVSNSISYMQIRYEIRTSFRLFLYLLLSLICSSLVKDSRFLVRAQVISPTLNHVESDQYGLYLFGLFDLHQASGHNQPFKCGPIELDAGQTYSRRPMQNFEAFLWAIEAVNADARILPGIKLGSITLDTCSSLLRTNQEFANILQGQSDTKLIESRQVMGVVADQWDWRSVEASTSIASSMNLTTFVTQTKSSRLSELARQFHQQQVNQLLDEQMAGSNTNANRDRNQSMPDLSLLSELLGIGRPLPGELFSEIDNKQASEFQRRTQDAPIDTIASLVDRLYMIRMPLANELLAEATVSLLDKLNWNLVSVIYDDEPEMMDLHDELARQLFSRATQLALDEQISTQKDILQSAGKFDQLVRKLITKRANSGSRIVISLMSNGNSRLLLEALRRARSSLKAKSQSDELRDLNSLLWITVSDREPYYALATDALGTIILSSSTSLSQSFKSHYERIASENRRAQNRWWPEYLRSILVKHRADMELLSNECAKWLEPKSSPLNEQCKSISLGSLIWGANTNSQQASSTSSRRKLTKYLASGWEHNGMDVINSVWAIANGLELVRQALCPNLKSGLCQEMSQLVKGSQKQDSVLPTLSQLIYSELIRSTFQLPDGKEFLLSDLNPIGSSQFETRVKFYNLRYLQSNSIGFVKFGQYDQFDGLSVNLSKARHYPTNSFDLQQPIDQVTSSCQDESKCLILSGLASTLMGSSSKSSIGSDEGLGGDMSEEELAMGLNSLFKLDHPLISGSFSSDSLDNNATKKTSNDEEPPDRSNIKTAGIHLDSSIHAIRAPNSQSSQRQFVDYLQNPIQAHELSTTRKRVQFNVILLLPLHKQSARWTSGNHSDCSNESIDVEHSFQHLVALAFAQSQWEESQQRASIGHRMLTQDSSNGQTNGKTTLDGSTSDQTSPTVGNSIELTANVIDYCGQFDLAELRLTKLLRSNQIQQSKNSLFVMDFDEKLAERIDGLTKESGLVHLTLESGFSSPYRMSQDARIKPRQENSHLHLSLLPSKLDEISALVKILSQMPNWRLVHLIYTDSHRHRDEFVRQANEANICVSKLIWVPDVSRQDAGNDEYAPQLDRIKHLFASELHDFHDKSLTSSSTQNEGLNGTRVIVVLASRNDATNRLILDAATQSMLDDYVWITSHEWLNSIELPAELEKSSDPSQQSNLPSNFLSTRLETIEGHDFRRYFASLTPAIHAPIPTPLFDQFWQQYHKCKLPIKSAMLTNGVESSWPTCKANQHLEAHRLAGDDRVHYTIKAIESIYATLDHALSQKQPMNGSNLAAQYRRVYGKTRPEDRKNSLHEFPYGFHIVHRLTSSNFRDSSGRHANSRHLSSLDTEEGRLQTVGFWRNNKLTLWPSFRESSANATYDDSTPSESGESIMNQLMLASFLRLSHIESRCSGSINCKLCRVQIEQSKAFSRQEEARYKLESSIDEPRAISSIQADLSGSSDVLREFEKSILSSDIELAASDVNKIQPSSSRRRQLEHVGDPDLDPLAFSDSMFDPQTAKKVELNQDTYLRQTLNQQSFKIKVGVGDQLRFSSALLLSSLSLIGVICMVVSMTHLYPSFVDQSPSGQKAHADSFSDEISASNSRTFDYINDYFILTGLLMLYCINVAFLLPATMGTCWFRRIGLAASYTILFTSILVKTVNCIRQSKPQRLNETLRRHQRELADSNRLQSSQTEENVVEVTFESLPTETVTTSLQNEVAEMSEDSHPGRRVETARMSQDFDTNQDERPLLILIAVGLIVVQLIVSLIWFIQQPPEPTLFNACWHCFSPSRSPVLFHYEPLISLLYPGSILVLAWFYSIANYRQNENLSRAERRELLHSERIKKYNSTMNSMDSLKQSILNIQMRNSKSLVMSTTLLILTWSTLTLSTISKNRPVNLQLRPYMRGLDPDVEGDDNLRSGIQNDLNLVYANLISGAIIFTSMFIYRHNLFAQLIRKNNPCLSFLRRARPTKLVSGSLSSISSRHQVSRSHQFNEAQDSKWLTEDSMSFRSPRSTSSSMVLFSGSQFQAPQGQERQRFQQLSESYGSTFSPNNPETAGINLISMNSLTSRLTAGSTGQRHRTKRSKLISPSHFLFGSSSSFANQRPKKNSNRSQKSSEIPNHQAASGSKLRRKESAGSVSSSTANLISRRGSLMEIDGIFLDGDSISVASSSTSQLHGNDLYPIDCSIQLDGPLGAVEDQSTKFDRQASTRGSIGVPKAHLSSVTEEPQQMKTSESKSEKLNETVSYDTTDKL